MTHTKNVYRKFNFESSFLTNENTFKPFGGFKEQKPKPIQPAEILDKGPRAITEAIFLVGTTRGLYKGHAALILMDKKGHGVLYSSMFDVRLLGKIANGEWVPYEIYRKELTPQEIASYFKYGRIPNTQESLTTWLYLSEYDKYIKIPVTNPDLGKIMYKRAEEIQKNPGLFNLYEKNCNHICQDILASAGLNFTPTRGSSDLVKDAMGDIKKYIKQLKFKKALFYTFDEFRKLKKMGIIPNGAYEAGVELAKKNGYTYGSIKINKYYDPSTDTEGKTKVKPPKPKNELTPSLQMSI